MFLSQFRGLVGQRAVRTFCLLILVLTVSGSTALGQYGFTPISTSTIGNEWGNYYLGSATQASSWNLVPGYYPTNNGYPTPRQLGVYLQNTPNGVIIGQINPGSVAERAGLKTGDLIVSVAGTQVGIVNGRVVDVMSVVNTNLDYFNRVNALVLDGSTRLMKSLVFDFSTNTTAITAVNGQVALEGGFPAYRSGTIKVDLVNLTRSYLTASGGNTYIQVNGTGPFAFSIPYDVRLNSQADQYRLVATYFDSNRQLVSSSSLDIGGINPAVPNSYSLRLIATPTSVPYSSAYGVYSPNPNMINDVFRQYLGRQPSISESQAWAQQISTRNLTEKDVKADILATPAFYDRAGNDPALFVKQMIESNTRLPATYDQIQYWTSRLGFYGGNRLQVTREYIYSF